jgi:SHS2 domain-containing protein
MAKNADYFDHAADMGIIGRGENVEDAFIGAALAMFNLMSDTKKISPMHRVEIAFEEQDLEYALVIWLNTLLAKARESNLIFNRFELKQDGARWQGCAYGDYWQEKYPRGTEVKGATLTMLKVSHNHEWEARCVVDM